MFNYHFSKLFVFTSMFLFLLSFGFAITISGCLGDVNSDYIGTQLVLDSNIPMLGPDPCFDLNADFDNNYFDLNCNGNYLLLGGANFFEIDQSIDKIYLRNCNLVVSTPIVYFHILSDLNQLFVLDSNILVSTTGSFFIKLDAFSNSTLDLNFYGSDFNLQNDGQLINILDSNISTLTMSDVNLIDIDDSNIVWIEGNNDVNVLDLSFLGTTILQDSTLVKLKSDDSEITMNFNDSDFNIQGDQGTAIQVDSAITSVTVNDLNIVDFGTHAVYSISGDVNYFVSNLTSGITIANTTANLFVFVGVDDGELNINMSNSDLNFANDVFWFDGSDINNLNIYNLALGDSTNLFTSINDANLYNLYLYDSNVRFDTLFDVNGIVTGKVWNNVLVDKNTDNNNIILESNITSNDVNIDFNTTLTTQPNIVGKTYKGGNYWTYSGDSHCVDITGDYLCDANQIVLGSDENYYDSLPLTTTRSAEMQATDISLNSSVSGTTSTATCTVRNNGDVSGTPATVKLYVENVLTDTNSTAQTVTAGSTKTYALDWAPAPTVQTVYDLNCVVTYTDWSSSNNNYATTKTIGGVSSSKKSGIDLKAMSLTYVSPSPVNKEVSFDFVFKNAGTKTATSDYTATLSITKKGSEVKKCTQKYTEDLDKSASKTFNCKWMPTETELYSLLPTIDYSGTDDSASNDTLSDKVIQITDTNAVIGSQDSNKPVQGTKIIDENKILQEYSDINSLIKDMNIAIYGLNLFLPDTNSIYLPVTVTRDFNCYKDVNDANKEKCNITLTLKNTGDKNISNYFYYEILPDLNNNARKLKFDINFLDINKEMKLTYALAGPVDKNTYPAFFGIMLKEDIYAKEDTTIKEEGWDFKISGTTLYWCVVGLVIILVCIAIIFYFKGRSSGFKYYKHYESRIQEPTPSWKGLGASDEKLKYKSGNHKLKETPVSSSEHKYKGWN